MFKLWQTNCITPLLWRCLECSEPLFTSSQVPRWSPSWWVSQVLEGCDCPVDTWWLQVSQVIIAGSDGGNQDRYSHPASSPSLVAEFLTEQPASRFRQIKRLWNNLIPILALTIEYLVNKPYTFLGIFLVHKRFGHCWLRARLLLHLTRSLDAVKAPINKKRRHWTVRCLRNKWVVFNCLKSLPFICQIDNGNILDSKVNCELLY